MNKKWSYPIGWDLCIGTCVVKGIEGFCGNPRQKVLI